MRGRERGIGRERERERGRGERERYEERRGESYEMNIWYSKDVKECV